MPTQFLLPSPTTQTFTHHTIPPQPLSSPHALKIRTHTIGLNPLDAKRLYHPSLFPHSSYPAVLGVDGAGVVEAAGEEVKRFRPGDEVFALGRMEEGTFQEVFEVQGEEGVGTKPRGMGWGEAASLPITDGNTGNSPLPKSVLVIGGSSAIGASAIQLLRLALGPTVTIIATASATHHAHLRSLGATACLERAAQADGKALRAVTPGEFGVDAILDAVGAAVEQPEIFGALKEGGLKMYAAPVTGREELKAPEGVRTKRVFGRAVFGMEGGKGAMQWLAQMLEDGIFKVPCAVEVAGKGLEGIEKGLRMLMEGVSGKKLVVSM
ncbi:MAG: hypothetical protein Q9227_002913 [Pyrenula ochraceoflavens]